MKEGNQETRLFIVEDDPSIRFGLEEILRAEGFLVQSHEEGTDAEAGIAGFLPDLLLLDVMLPGKNGYEICKSLRRQGCRIPILMLTAKGQEIDKVIGLEAGADDYVTKPFGIQELIARVHALLRRVRMSREEGESGAVPGDPSFVVGKAKIRVDTFEAIVGDASSRLTPKEMELLRYFDRNRGKVLSRDALLEAVWGVRYFGTTRTLDQCVAQIRKKIGDSGPNPSAIVTVHGVGYRLI